MEFPVQFCPRCGSGGFRGVGFATESVLRGHQSVCSGAPRPATRGLQRERPWADADEQQCFGRGAGGGGGDAADAPAGGGGAPAGGGDDDDDGDIGGSVLDLVGDGASVGGSSVHSLHSVHSAPPPPDSSDDSSDDSSSGGPGGGPGGGAAGAAAVVVAHFFIVGGIGWLGNAAMDRARRYAERRRTEIDLFAAIHNYALPRGGADALIRIFNTHLARVSPRDAPPPRPIRLYASQASTVARLQAHLKWTSPTTIDLEVPVAVRKGPQAANVAARAAAADEVCTVRTRLEIFALRDQLVAIVTDRSFGVDAFLWDPSEAEPAPGPDRIGSPGNSDHARDIYRLAMTGLHATHGPAIAALRGILAARVPPVSLTVGVALLHAWFDSMLVGARGNSTKVLLWRLLNFRSRQVQASLACIMDAALLGPTDVAHLSTAVTLEAVQHAKEELFQNTLMEACHKPIMALRAQPILFSTRIDGRECAYIITAALCGVPGDSPALAAMGSFNANASATHDYSRNLSLQAPQHAGLNVDALRRNAASIAATYDAKDAALIGSPMRRVYEVRLLRSGLHVATPQLLLAHFRGLATGHLYVLRGCLLHILRLGLWLDFWHALAVFIARAPGSNAAGDVLPAGNVALALHAERVSALPRFSDGFSDVEAVRGPWPKAAKRTGAQIYDGIRVFGHACDERVLSEPARLEAARLLSELAERLSNAAGRSTLSELYGIAATALLVRFCALSVAWFTGAAYYDKVDATGARVSSTKSSTARVAFSPPALRHGATKFADCENLERALAHYRDAYNSSGKGRGWRPIAARDRSAQCFIARFGPELAHGPAYVSKLVPGAQSLESLSSAFAEHGARCAPRAFPAFAFSLAAVSVANHATFTLSASPASTPAAFSHAVLAYLSAHHAANVEPAPGVTRPKLSNATAVHSLVGGPVSTLADFVAPWPAPIRGHVNAALAACFVGAPAQPQLADCLLQRSVRVDSVYINGVHVAPGDIVAFECLMGAAPPPAAVYTPYDARTTTIAAVQALFKFADELFALVHSFKPCTDALAATVRGYERFCPRVVRTASTGLVIIPVATIAWLVHPLPLYNNNRQGPTHLVAPEYPSVGLRAILFKPRPDPDSP